VAVVATRVESAGSNARAVSVRRRQPPRPAGSTATTCVGRLESADLARAIRRRRRRGGGDARRPVRMPRNRSSRHAAASVRGRCAGRRRIWARSQSTRAATRRDLTLPGEVEDQRRPPRRTVGDLCADRRGCDRRSPRAFPDDAIEIVDRLVANAGRLSDLRRVGVDERRSETSGTGCGLAGVPGCRDRCGTDRRAEAGSAVSSTVGTSCPPRVP
jgi:hypothetical protein